MKIKNMKRKLLFFAMLLNAVMCWGAKAWNEPIVVKQSDGSSLTFCLHGDEHFSWRTTIDGALIVEKDGNYYIALIDKQGNISASTQLAHNKAERTAVEQQLVEKQNKDLYFNKTTTQIQTRVQRREPVQSSYSTFPHTGSPKAIVILAQFTDSVFKLSNPKISFEKYLNSMEKLENLGNDEHRNSGSVKKYFSDMSNGQFTPQFDLYGPVTLPNKLAYYGKNTSSKGGSDAHYQSVVNDALQLALTEIPNLKDYDSNNDGYIDLVYVIHAGYSESVGNSTDALWPKSFTYQSTAINLPYNLKIGRCGISNELNGRPTSYSNPRINGIGLFCHEFSHCLGLPDFYPTNQSSFSTLYDLDNQGMEFWSIMDNGPYINSGYTPAAYTAWEREAFGWTKIDTLKNEQQVKLISIDEDGKAYRIMNDANTSGKEYYIIENIQQKKWNARQYGHGLLIYHVNYDDYIFSLKSNSPNNIQGKPRMTVIPADGQLVSSYRVNEPAEKGGTTPEVYKSSLAGDPFPGTSSVVTITDAMNFPNYAPWTGGTLNKPIYNIREIDETNIDGTTSKVIYFDFLKDFTSTGIADNIIDKINEIDDRVNRIYSIDGVFMGTSTDDLPKGIYIKNKKKFIIR